MTRFTRPSAVLGLAALALASSAAPALADDIDQPEPGNQYTIHTVSWMVDRYLPNGERTTPATASQTTQTLMGPDAPCGYLIQTDKYLATDDEIAALTKDGRLDVGEDAVIVSRNPGGVSFSWTGDCPVAKTTKVIVPGTPAVTKVVEVHNTVAYPGGCSDPVVGTFQVDQYLDGRGPRYAKDGKLTAGEDKKSVGHSRYEFVTIHYSDLVKYDSLRNAINAKTTKVANLGPNVVAWKLGKGATVKQPWGANHKVAQVIWSVVGTPKPVCKTVTRDVITRQTVVVKKATPASSHMAVTYWCNGDQQVSGPTVACMRLS